MILAHWTYNKEEWTKFMRHNKGRKSVLHYLLTPFFFLMNRRIPEVRITQRQVWIGNDYQHFNSNECEISGIDLRNEGKVNILSIGYKNRSDKSGIKEIKILVPKGKLREAIEVQERLRPGNRTIAAV